MPEMIRSQVQQKSRRLPVYHLPPTTHRNQHFRAVSGPGVWSGLLCSNHSLQLIHTDLHHPKPTRQDWKKEIFQQTISNFNISNSEINNSNRPLKIPLSSSESKLSKEIEF